MNESFAERWLQKERELGIEDFTDGMVRTTADVSGLDDASRRLLTESGLPASARPFLSFDHTATLLRIWEVYSPGQWRDDQKSHLLEVRMLGSDGAGNPICLNDETGEVWLLDHEDWFHTRQFVNSSVVQLAECLLLCMFERETNTLRKNITTIDKRAMSEGSFWWHEAVSLDDRKKAIHQIIEKEK